MTVIVRAASLRGWASLVRRLGGDPAELLAGASLRPDALDDEDNLIPAASAMRLLESTAVQLNCPDLGLQLASSQDPTALGPLALALRSAPTVRDMLAMTTRYLFVHSPALSFEVVDAGPEFPEHIALQMDIVMNPRPPARQTWDIGLATAHQLYTHLVGRPYRPRAVLLPHVPVAPIARYVQYFEASVFTERRHGALILHQSLLDMALRDVDETLRTVATSYLDDHFPSPTATTADIVRAALAHTVGTPRSTIAGVAELLTLHPRTLQRRLAAEGTTFAQLRDEALKKVAHQYITETAMSMAEITTALGLSEQSVLTTACRRWFGLTPSQLRRRRT